MDRAAEALLRELLAAHRPDDGVLGEEAGCEPGRSGLTWVVDPIDGTVNYLYGIPALRGQRRGRHRPPRRRRGAGRPSPAACTTVPRGETWTAAPRPRRLARRAAAAADQARPPLDRAPWSPPASATGPSAGEPRPGCWPELLPRVRDIRRVGCVRPRPVQGGGAAGYDAYYERGLHVWDFAAAILVATEAGAVVGAGRRPALGGAARRRPPAPRSTPSPPSWRASRTPSTDDGGTGGAQVRRRAAGPAAGVGRP